MEQADGYRLNPAVQHGLHRPVNVVHVQRPQDLAAEIQSFSNLETVLTLDEGRGLLITVVLVRSYSFISGSRSDDSVRMTSGARSRSTWAMYHRSWSGLA